jgi:hypothetical protein
VAKDSASSSDVKTTGEKADSASAKDAKAADAKGASPASKAKDDYAAQIAEVNKQIADLEHELDLMTRESRLRAAAYYADAGNSLRNPQEWAKQEADFKTQREQKQAQLEQAKQKLADLQEQQRRAASPLP